MSSEIDEIIIDCKPVKKAESFVFLGSVVPGTSADVKRRIALAAVAFGKLQNIRSNTTVSLKLKIRLYNTLILPISK